MLTMSEERNTKILEAYRAGSTLRELAREHGLTYQRVSQLLHSLGEFSGESRRGKNKQQIEAARRKKEAKDAHWEAIQQGRKARLKHMSDIWLSDMTVEEKTAKAGFSKPSALYAYAHRYRAQYPELFPYRPSGQGRKDATAPCEE